MSISTEKQAHITLPTGMKGILFDFDDTMYAWEEVIRHWATAFTRKHNISDDPAIVDHIVDLLVTVDYHGSTPRIELFRFLQQEYPAFDTALEDLQQHYQEELLSSMIARPDAGAYPLLHALHANHIPFSNT
uniref:Haloacid dehalogenase n=1 Tax=Thermosporothrix sp. COM3 TaxID=2490863 RepID=A0A455SJ10_9CHLR|nr:hypothetical protein KTC_08860 [Thermosporothrix sp. COM3]